MKETIQITNGLVYIGSFIYALVAHDWRFLVGFLVATVTYIISQVLK